MRDRDEVAGFLIERGANIEPDNRSPLCRAVESGREQIVQRLLASGARVRWEVQQPSPLLFDAFDALEWARQGNPVNTPAINTRIIRLLEEAQRRQAS